MAIFLKYLAGLLVLALGVAGVMLWFDFRSSIVAARERVRGKSVVVPSSFGDLEYSEGGAGPAVLVIHGSGGGFDQGELIVQSVLDDRFHWIAPSRFGYLRSTFHDGATFDDQAHAYTALLDQLGIERVAVVALSHGGPSALLFAVLYPERVASLTLISCGVAPAASDEQAQANTKGNTLVSVYKEDYRYWLITRLFRKQFLQLIGVDDTVIANLTAGQRVLIDRVVDEMNPVSLRAAGVAFDNQATLPGDRIAAIRSPTLIIHAQDDTLQLYHNAEFAAATIPGARLLSFERGGHFVMVTEQEAVRAAVQGHIQDHTGS
ncbi:MAG: alpha/beta hydrolase [Caldilineaceae bacterium]|nr:alpha/beta hydrolase [Caldilineaceae bacterium]